MLKKQPFIFLMLICASAFAAKYMPFELKNIFYSIGGSVKSILYLTMPFIIFGLLFKVTVKLTGSISRLIGITLISVIASGLLALFLGRFIALIAYRQDLSILIPQEQLSLTYLWEFNIQPLFSNTQGMIFGILLGFISHKIAPDFSKKASLYIELFIAKIIKALTLIIPLFVISVIIKLQHDNSLSILINEYLKILLFIAISIFTYQFILFYLLSNCSIKETIRKLKNMIPAVISAFSTMSSLASMPFTISGSKLNVKNGDIPETTIPMTTNVHLLGDCFAIPILIYAVLKSFGIMVPSCEHHMLFAVSFIIYAFSIAGAPGGGVLVILSVLEKRMGFNTDMLSMITALYILFDPIITTGNVLGNSALSMFIEKFFSTKRIKQQKMK